MAQTEGFGIDLDIKGEPDILQSMQICSAFLADPSHKILFNCTSKHCSWLNRIEMWFSIFVRKLLRRADFVSKEQLKIRILEFVDYFNRILAKPFK